MFLSKLDSRLQACDADMSITGVRFGNDCEVSLRGLQCFLTFTDWELSEKNLRAVYILLSSSCLYFFAESF